MKQITITEKELLKAYPKVEGQKYKHCFSPSGMLIDELAYCAGQWTSEDLCENNFEYEPREPYSFNYEEDLFKATKTGDQLYAMAQKLEVSINANWSRLCKEQKLQAGACVALNNPGEWSNLLSAYTEKLQADGVDGISEAYNKELQDEKDSYNDDQYREWLNGDHRDYRGVVYEIAKYFTDERDGSYTKYNEATKTDASYTFTLNENDIETAKDNGYNKNQLKAWLLDSIIASGNDREREDKKKREARKEERERLAIYKKKQAEEADADRKAKLLAMTL